jgi:hypothetical protein
MAKSRSIGLLLIFVKKSIDIKNTKVNSSYTRSTIQNCIQCTVYLFRIACILNSVAENNVI